ncbi:hypothetical protein OG607_26170 [Streptomyces sp. NBC_01537]|uniref:hypothetical protein n=1 Tax=Streptomyces sp. NBC_01537 TaxID=2903896 RepID=UPI00386C3E71
MQRRLGGLRLVAVLAVVVVSLTGFQTRVHKHRSSGSGSGGGCSSSHSTSHSYNTGSSGSTSGSTSGSGTKPTASVMSCADGDGSSVVVVDDTAGGKGGDYVVEVTFYDADGKKVDTGRKGAYITAGGTTNVVVEMDNPELDDGHLTCKVTGLS